MFLLVSSWRPPPLTAGTGLGRQTALMWHRTRFLSFWAGFWVVPTFYVFRPAYTPPLSTGPWPG